MSLSSKVTLGALRLQAQQRADLENSPNITTPEWNQYLSQSYKELYDMLVSAYGNEYYVKAPYTYTLTAEQFYDLPADFYKLLGVDLQYSSSPSGWVTIPRFEFIERNKYAYPNTAGTWLGYSNLRYRIMADQLELIPVPASGQTARIWYIPEPTSINFMPSCSTVVDSPVISLADVSILTAGMSAYGSNIAPGTIVLSVDTVLNQATLSTNATSTRPTATLQFWIDSTTIDGISGWEEYVIVDAAIKAGIKQETDIGELKLQKLQMKQRIEGMAEGRDAGQAHHVSDVLSIQGGQGWSDCGGYGDGGFGW